MARLFYLGLPYASLLLAALFLAARLIRAYLRQGKSRDKTRIDLGRQDFLLKYSRRLLLFCLSLIFIKHLRYFLYPVPDIVFALSTFGTWAGFIAPIPAIILLWRRLALRPLLLMQDFGDIVLIVLLALAVVTGSFLVLGRGADPIQVKMLVMNMIHPSTPPMTPDWLPALHLIPVLILIPLLIPGGPWGLMGFVRPWPGETK